MQAIRPKLTLYKTVEEAAVAVDDMFNAALQNAGCTFVYHVCRFIQLTV